MKVLAALSGVCRFAVWVLALGLRAVALTLHSGSDWLFDLLNHPRLLAWQTRAWNGLAK